MSEYAPIVLVALLVLGVLTMALVYSATRTQPEDNAELKPAPKPVRRVVAKRVHKVAAPTTTNTHEQIGSPHQDLKSKVNVVAASAEVSVSPISMGTVTPSETDSGAKTALRNLQTLESGVRRLIEQGRDNVIIELPPIVPIQPLVKNLMRSGSRRFQVLTRFESRASLIGASTIHSFFRFPDPMDTHSPVYDRPRLASVFEEIDTFVIDSFASVEAHLLHAVDWCLRRTLGTNEPFGGKRVVLIGSMFDITHLSCSDLSPSAKVDSLSYPVSNSSSYTQARFSVYECGQLLDCYSFSNRGRAFVQDLVGDRLTTDDLRNFVSGVEAGTRHHVVCVRSRKSAERLNAQRLNVLPGNSKVYKSWSESPVRPEHAPAPNILELRPDAIVLFLSTNTDAGWHRGMLGMVRILGDKHIEVLTERNQMVRVEAETWQRVELTAGERGGEFVFKSTGKYCQLPVQLGWFVSIDNLPDMQIRNIRFSDSEMRPLRPGELLWSILHARSEENVMWPKNLKQEEVQLHPLTLSKT